MMKLFKFVAVALIGIIGITACNGGGGETDPLSVSTASLIFTTDGGSQSVTVNGADWQATPSAAWIEIAPASGVAGGTFTVTVAAGTEDKSGNITVTNTATGREKIVTVTQSMGNVTGVTLNKATASIAIGNSETLTATVLPESAINKSVTWTSSDNTVATVVGGVVTGVAVGSATITVTTVESGYTATCTVTVNEPKLYMAGKSNSKATLWVNNEEQTIGEQDTEAMDVEVSGDDVYVVGWKNNYSDPTTAILWKNGVAETLPGHNGLGNAVFISGSDVYVAGKTQIYDEASYMFLNQATLWINGEAQILGAIPNGTGYSWARDIWVSGDDVYIVGEAKERVGEYGSKDVAVLWKNGVPEVLESGIWAYGIYVSGSDIYVTGTKYPSVSGIENLPALWKNGVPQDLAETNQPIYRGRGNQVFVSEGNVYVAGHETSFTDAGYRLKAVLWTNGAGQIYSDVTMSEVYSVCVSGGDVYAAGLVPEMATLWKNGELVWQGPQWSVAKSVIYK